MLYDSKAILRSKWLKEEDKFLAEGWEFVELNNGVVYLRRPLEKWETVKLPDGGTYQRRYLGDL